MRKKDLLTGLLLCAVLLSGCDDKEPYTGEGIDSQFNGYYSNRVSKDPLAGELELTYSDAELVGKEFHFHVMTENSARITFNDLIYRQPTITVADLPLTKTPDGGYSFTGNHSTTDGISFSFTGSVTRADGAILPVMKMAVTDVRFPDNILSARGTFDILQTSTETQMIDNGDHFVFANHFSVSTVLRLKYRGADGNQKDLITDPGGANLTPMVHLLLSNLLYLVLPDVTFHPDGNVTATYCPLDSELNIMNLVLSPPTDGQRMEKRTSPKNLVTYYVDGDILYIKPYIVQIVRTIQNNSATRADDEPSFGLGDLLSYLPQILELTGKLGDWLDKGIVFHLESNHPDEPVIDYLSDDDNTGFFRYYYYFAGEYKLYMDQEELMPLLNLVPLVLEMMSIDLGNFELMPGMSMDLATMLDNMLKMNDAQLGLYL